MRNHPFKVFLVNQLSATWLPIECHLTSNGVSLDCQWNHSDNFDKVLSHILRKHPFKVFFSEPIECHFTSNRVSLDCQLNHSENFEQKLSHIIYIMRKYPFKVFLVTQLSATWLPIECHLTSNGVSLDCQWNHSENFEQVLSHILRKHPFKVFLGNQLSAT